MKVREAVFNVGLERGLRQSTVFSYERLLGRLGILDLETSQVTLEGVSEALWTIDSPNTRRSACVALRSVLGLQVKIPRGVPRRYDLPDEDTLRLALMTSPHEIRGLLMMYGGLRVGEACAITHKDVHGDRLSVDKQIQQLHRKGQEPIIKVGPVKTNVGDVVIPHWLAERVSQITETEKPDSVRESLRRAGKKVGIDLNPHLLRHWHATALLSRGVAISAVSRQMRHSDVAVTLRTYSQFDLAADIHKAFG